MNLNTGPIKDWFGFSRRERRSTFALLIIVVIIIGFKHIVPDSKITIEDITDSLLVAEAAAANDSVSNYKSYSSQGNPIDKKFKTSYVRKPKISGSLIQKENYSSDKKKQIIEINRSDSATLVRLPGIGPVLSARIVKYRNLLGGFARIGQLKEVYGLPEETFEMIKNRISVDTSFITRININTSDYKELYHIRYFDKYELSSIMKYRQLKGKIESMTELIDNKIITKEKALIVGPYLKFK
jgi:competence ComEA-like helix-hairpin-helix protein